VKRQASEAFERGSGSPRFARDDNLGFAIASYEDFSLRIEMTNSIYFFNLTYL